MITRPLCTLPPYVYEWRFGHAERYLPEPELAVYRVIWRYSAPRFTDIAGADLPAVRDVNAHLDAGGTVADWAPVRYDRDGNRLQSSRS